MQNLIILAIVVAVVYPLQKKLRETVSRRRRERWAEEDRQAELQRQEQGAPARDDGPIRPSEDRTRTTDDPND